MPPRLLRWDTSLSNLKKKAPHGTSCGAQVIPNVIGRFDYRGA